MKKSLKDIYASFLKEDNNTLQPNSELNSQIDPDEVRVIFPDDDNNIARLYKTNTENSSELINSKNIDLSKSEDIKLNSISSINTSYLSNARKYADSDIKKLGFPVRVKKVFIDMISLHIEKNLMKDLINISENKDDTFSLISKLKSFEKNNSIVDNLIEIINSEKNNSNNSIKSKTIKELFQPTENPIEITFRLSDCVIIPSNIELIKKNIKDSAIAIMSDEFKNDLKKTVSKLVEFVIGSQISLIEEKINNPNFSDDKSSYNINQLNRSTIILAILNEYCDNVSIPRFKKDIKNLKKEAGNNVEKIFRHSSTSIDNAIDHLNKYSKYFLNYEGKGGGQGQVKGAGEFHVHAFLKTSNVCLNIEPDAILSIGGTDFPCSIKKFNSTKDTAQTGGKMSADIKNKFNKFLELFFKNPGEIWPKDSLTYTKIFSKLTDNKNNLSKIFKFIDDDNKVIKEAQKKALDAYKEFKISIASEHNAKGVIAFFPKNNSDSNKLFNFVTKEECGNKHYLTLDNIPSNQRISFCIRTSDNSKYMPLDKAVLGLIDPGFGKLYILDQYLNKKQNDNYLRKGKVLKEVYSHLYSNKKVINEGGVGGHMLHPYEVLEGTPRDLINRIKQYGVSQKLIEKVDGQNLFFTVEKDGTPLFARNKQDMTHQDLIEKFTGHGAEQPFLEGGNAIVQGVQQWKNSGPQFFEQEVIETFHPVEGQKSFINFEIMHPDKPNQIKYDKRYIVFHGIVDFEYDEEGREEVYRTNKGERLQRIIRQMRPGVQSAGFVLASNRTVDMNALTNVQIAGYVEQIKQIAASIGITEDQDFATGVVNSIKQKLAAAEIETNKETLKKIEEFVLYGEDIEGNSIQGKDVKKLFSKEDAKKLTALGLTSATKASRIISDTLTQFAPIFVNLGIDLLSGVKSAYMSDDFNKKNIDELREKLQTAIDDYDIYVATTPDDEQSNIVKRLKRHIDVVKDTGLENIVNSAVEGGVYDENGDLLKVTGGFAPLNQIIGAAYRDNEGIFPTFIKKYRDVEKNESKKYSLKSVFNLID